MNTSDQFVQAIATEVLSRIEERLSRNKRIYTLQEAALYLGLTPKALRQKVAKDEVKPCCFDRLLRFDIRDLDDYIEANKNFETV
jgi:hypothetical protein